MLASVFIFNDRINVQKSHLACIKIILFNQNMLYEHCRAHTPTDVAVLPALEDALPIAIVSHVLGGLPSVWPTLPLRRYPPK